MNIQVIKFLNQLNQVFYNQQSVSWSRSRQYFWPSWDKFWQKSGIEHLDKAKLDHFQVVDVGCGTGRFLSFWQKKMPSSVDFKYIGLDGSKNLLDIARLSFSETNQTKWLLVDVVDRMAKSKKVIKEPVDLIVLFGVLHHIPDHQLRDKLLQQLAENLNQGGQLWITLWRPSVIMKQGPKEIPWPVSDSDKSVKLNDLPLPNKLMTELEAGDVLLGWQKSKMVRYVHWISDEEVNRMSVILCNEGLKKIADWNETSQGERGNQCLIWQKI